MNFRYIGAEIGAAVSAIAGAYAYDKLSRHYQLNDPIIKEVLTILPGKVIVGATIGYFSGAICDLATFVVSIKRDPSKLEKKATEISPPRSQKTEDAIEQ